MTQNFIAFIMALLCALVLTPLAKYFAFKLNFLDKPDIRKIHKRPIPLLGGVAIFLSFAATSSVFLYFEKFNFWLMFFGLVFVLFGLIDDKGIKIRARYKIWSHLLFSFLFVLSSGIGLQFFSNEWLNILLSICFITFMTNSMNMLDGMDGLVSGVSAIASFFFFLLSLNSGQWDLAVLSLLVLGACLGFLRYNFNPASIFLGEAGSTFLGFIMAVLAIKLNATGLWDVALALHVTRLQIISFILPLILLGIPIFDTYFVFTNRFLHQIKFSQPGKDHSHHRIHLMGFSQKMTVLTIYAIQVVLGAIVIALVRADLQQFFSLLAIVFILFMTFTAFLSRAEVYG